MFKNINATKWTYIHFFLLFLMLFLSVSFSDSNNSLRLSLQHGVFDQFNKWHPRERSNKVIIVDIDDSSLKELGQWPWSRYILADLVRSLTEKGAKSIAFDGVFAEEDRTSPHYFISHLKNEQFDSFSNIELDNYDDIFANEIKKSKIFITAFTSGNIENKPVNKNRILARSDVKKVFLSDAYSFKGSAVNLPQFAKNAAGNGSFMARPDGDGVLRRTGMIFTDGNKLYPSLSLEALRIAALSRKGSIKLAAVPEGKGGLIDTNYRILIGDNYIPVESDGIIYLRYRHLCNQNDVDNGSFNCFSKDYFSAYKFLDPKYEQESIEAVKGKIVLIGASAEGLKDLRNTALSPFRPGVEIHANVIEQVLTGEYLLRPEIINGVEASFILVSGLFFIITAPFIGILVSVFLCLSIILTAFIGAYVVYVDYGVLIDPVYPAISVSIIFVVSTILSYARAESRRKQIRSAFGMYVAPDVMRELENNPEKLKLGGENRDLTVMFTDIRKFTSISEGLSPQELIELMNEFLTVMSDIVMEHKGTVDKYIGDAMMAFWNAPKDVENHEHEACIAALKMQSALAPINNKVEQRALELGKVPVLLNAGIGINTGICAVGNMGSKQRFAYSALGDAVNLSARLEGQTKFYGVDILVGQNVYEKVQNFAMLELDLIKVIGRGEPVRIYWLIGDEAAASSKDFKDWQLLNNKMLILYREKKFDDALLTIAECKNIADKRANYFYDMYEKRIKDLKKLELPNDWNGIYITQSK